MPEEVLNSLFVGRIGDVNNKVVSLVADGSDDSAVLLFHFGQLKQHQRQRRVPGLPDLAPGRPAVRGGLVDVDDLPILGQVGLHLPAEQDSQPPHLHLRLGRVPAAVHLEESHAHLLVGVAQRGGADVDPELSLNQYASLDQVQMRLLPQDSRGSQGFHLFSCELPCLWAHLRRAFGIQLVLVLFEALHNSVDSG